jgi:GntR family transcriptional regulator
MIVVDMLDIVDRYESVNRAAGMTDLLRVRPEETTMPAVPKYERVAEAIRAQIRAGLLKPGDRLPITDLLMAEHGVGYGTLRTALIILTSEGLIEGRQGEGRFVTPDAPNRLR